MANLLTELLGSIPHFFSEFGDILVMSPVQAVLLIMGGVLLAVVIVIMVYLVLGALVHPINRLSESGGPPQQS